MQHFATLILKIKQNCHKIPVLSNKLELPHRLPAKNPLNPPKVAMVAKIAKMAIIATLAILATLAKISPPANSKFPIQNSKLKKCPADYHRASL